jgi:Amt family ammonium transporter
MQVDETLDIFAVHGVSGFIGSVMLGIFADKNVMALSGIPVTSEGGWVNGHYMQILYQLGGSSFSMAYSGCATLLLCTS